MSKQDDNAQFQRALDAMDAATNDQEFRKAMAMLPKPPPEFLVKLDKYGDFINPQENPRFSSTEAPTYLSPSTSTTPTEKTTDGSDGAST